MHVFVLVAIFQMNNLKELD